MRRDPLHKCHRTCRMCAYYGQECYFYGESSRHPRARAMKCDQYENFTDGIVSLGNIVANWRAIYPFNALIRKLEFCELYNKARKEHS